MLAREPQAGICTNWVIYFRGEAGSGGSIIKWSVPWHIFTQFLSPGLQYCNIAAKVASIMATARLAETFYKYFEFFNFVAASPRPPAMAVRLILFLPQPQFLLILSIAIVNLFIKQNFCISFLHISRHDCVTPS